MHKLVVVLLLSINCFSQNNEVFVSLGKPWFPDMSGFHKNNFTIGSHYKNTFSESFAYELLYEYGQSDDLSMLGEDGSNSNGAILGQNINNVFLGTAGLKIQTHRVGVKMHFLFVNNPKVSFGIFAGSGFLFSNSESNGISEITFNPETGEILDFAAFSNKNSFNNFYYDLGFQFHYTVYENYSIGIIPTFVRAFDNDKTLETLIFPSYYNASFLIGYKF